jgi:hypothetical protein
MWIVLCIYFAFLSIVESIFLKDTYMTEVCMAAIFGCIIYHYLKSIRDNINKLVDRK